MGTTGRQVSFGAGGLAIRRPIMRFTWIAGPARARKTSRHTAQRKAARYPGSTGAPVLPGGQYLNMSFRWTFHPAEYATDILFRQRQDLICMRR